MGKRILGIVVGVIGIVAIGLVAVVILKGRTSDGIDASSDGVEVINDIDEEDKVSGKILVAYYSAQNHTKVVAEKIAQELGADIFEIVPQKIYTAEDLDWTADGSRVNREHDDESLRDIALAETIVPNWEEYDTVLIGYPIWWGIAAWPVDNFVKENDFDGKTVIPFCTSTSSGLGQSGRLLEEMANGGDWREGYRFSSNPSDTEIENWARSL